MYMGVSFSVHGQVSQSRMSLSDSQQCLLTFWAHCSTRHTAQQRNYRNKPFGLASIGDQTTSVELMYEENDNSARIISFGPDIDCLQCLIRSNRCLLTL